MMFTSKNNLYVGRGGKNSYVRVNLPYGTITLEDNWLYIRNDPLISRFELDSIIDKDYSENVVITVSGRFLKEETGYFLYGRFDITIKYTIHDEIIKYGELHVRCNFKNNKLDGLYYAVATVDNDSLIKYIEYENGIQISDVTFKLGLLKVILYDQSGRPYEKHFYRYPEEYINIDVLFEHYPDLDVSHGYSYDGVKNFINNLKHDVYDEFELFSSQLVQDNVYKSIDHNYKVIKEIPYIDEMSTEKLKSLFSL